MRLVQLMHPQAGRRVARVSEPHLLVLAGSTSVYGLAQEALKGGLEQIVTALAIETKLDYDPIYAGQSDWRLLPAFDHPEFPARCLVSGTGLTHTASARKRDAMHTASTPGPAGPLSDSMRMFRAGVEGGRPAAGHIGQAPEWFYKGNGASLCAHGEPLHSPPFADDGGEEPEMAGCYFITPGGTPCRVGLAAGNEFSDHVREKMNYLYLAESKLRPAGLGPELLVGEIPADIRGRVSIERDGREIWSAPVATGEANMCHSLANIEHHHFKHPPHRRPGDAHVHFFGADDFSFGSSLRLADGDVMVVSWPPLGRALRNPLHQDPGPQPLVRVEAL
jgi:hypothetical protein